MVQCFNELSPCFSSMFVCYCGDLVVHLLQGFIMLQRSSRALILSNISAGTCFVLIRCRPEGICYDAALRMMVRKIFFSFSAVCWKLSFVQFVLYLLTIWIPVFYL